MADGVRCAADIDSSLLVIENGADDAVPQPRPRLIFDAARSKDKTFELIDGATHYYAGQPQLLVQVTELMRDWLHERKINL